MQYEVRKSGGPVCPTCGSTELVTTALTAEALTRDIRAAISDLTPARWRVFARRRVAHLARLDEESVETLKKLTHLV